MALPLTEKAIKTIGSVFTNANHPPDAERSLRNAARATTILGRMLEDLTTKFATRASPAAKIITNAGLLFYGLVEIAVPRSLAYHLGRYWIKLLLLVGTAMVPLGIFAKSAGTWKIGLSVILFSWVASALRDFLSWVMRKRDEFPVASTTLLSPVLFIISLVVLAIIYAPAVNQSLARVESGLTAAHVKAAQLLHASTHHNTSP